MLNFVQEGCNLDLTAPYDVSAGDGMLVGSLFAVAATDAASSATVVGVVRGVFTLAKTSAQAWTQGASIYWDDTNKVCTTTSTSNTLIGYAVKAAANPSSTGTVYVK